MIRDKSGSGDNSQTLWLYAGTEFNKKRQASLYTEYRGNKVIRGNNVSEILVLWVSGVINMKMDLSVLGDLIRPDKYHYDDDKVIWELCKQELHQPKLL